MSKILTEITAQRFELIRDRIAEIITDELNGQFIITSNSLFSAKVWLERFIPFDKTELPAVNIYFNGSNFDSQTPISSKSNNNYNIECSVSAKDTDSDAGDILANKKCHKLIGAIRYILENPNYLELDFTNPRFVFSTIVNNINISQPTNNSDGTFSVSAQIIFNVVSEELNGELSAIEAEKYTTTMKLNETEKGFYYELIN